LVKQVIAWVSQSPHTVSEQLSAIIERKQAQREGAGKLH
jgi:hypothetical protein